MAFYKTLFLLFSLSSFQNIQAVSNDLRRPTNDQYQARLRTQADWSKMGAGIVTLLAGQDVEVALKIAENAVRNNLVPLLVAAAMGALTVWGTFDTIQEVIQAHKENGINGVLEYLTIKKIIEVTLLKTGKMAFKVGQKAYTAFEPALEAAMASSPKLKHLAQACEQQKDKITAWAKEKYSPSSQVSVTEANKGIYDPHEVRKQLETKYPGQVSSSTVPSSNAKNVKLAGQAHPETGIIFDQRGFPIFDNVTKFDTKISQEVIKTESSKAHMRAATRDLRENILNGKIDKTNFTEKQLTAIMSGKDRIPEMTWHHHQDIGRMQLIPIDIHKKTGHVGGMDLWNQK